MATSRSYSLFLAVQTVGAVVLFWHAIPLYRQVLENPAAHEPRLETLLWSLPSIGLMQAGYWVSRHVNPPLPHLRNAFIGHIVLFVARMSLVLATSSFAFVFLLRNADLQIPLFRYAVFIAGLFALFCYVQELDRLGRALIESK
jgi:hypothetical protein